ncbi:hypothetical protein HDU85_001743 [Gaertneriomyces sp. JEL0708]|nr:hypothetical protein HDU85_001743 [Gaertneriomyces sp. JEL0708]
MEPQTEIAVVGSNQKVFDNTDASMATKNRLGLSTAELLEELVFVLSERRGCIVIGAGVSASLADNEESRELVTWKGFLEKLAITVRDLLHLDPEWYDEVKAMLAETKKGKKGEKDQEKEDKLRLDKAAEMIEHYVNTGHLGGSNDPFMRYHHLVFKILHTLRANKDAPLADLLGRLHAPIFTTNYDVLLEDATGRFTLSIEDLLKAQRMYRVKPEQHPLAQHEQYVFHLHGIYYDDPERKFVLTTREYAITIDDFILALKPVLIDIGSKVKTGGRAFHRSMIFIGTGGTLQDIHFTSLFAGLYEHNTYLEANGYDRVLHYVLLNEVEAATVTDFTFEDSLGRAIHAHELLVPVVYGRDYSDLPIFMEKLVRKLEEEEHGVGAGTSRPDFRPICGSPGCGSPRHHGGFLSHKDKLFGTGRGVMESDAETGGSEVEGDVRRRRSVRTHHKVVRTVTSKGGTETSITSRSTMKMEYSSAVDSEGESDVSDGADGADVPTVSVPIP